MNISLTLLPLLKIPILQRTHKIHVKISAPVSSHNWIFLIWFFLRRISDPLQKNSWSLWEILTLSKFQSSHFVQSVFELGDDVVCCDWGRHMKIYRFAVIFRYFLFIHHHRILNRLSFSLLILFVVYCQLIKIDWYLVC